MGSRKCPRCGSVNVKRLGVPQSPGRWECEDCGYVGVLIIEDGKLPYRKLESERYGTRRRLPRGPGRRGH